MISRRDFTRAAICGTSTAAAAAALAKEQEDQSRLKAFYVSERKILDVLRGRLRVTGWPEDSKFVAAEYSVLYQGFRIVVQSDEFDPVPHGDMIPPGPQLTIERRGVDA